MGSYPSRLTRNIAARLLVEHLWPDRIRQMGGRLYFCVPGISDRGRTNDADSERDIDMSYKDFRDLDLLRQMENEMQRIADETLRGFFSDVPTPNRFWQPRVDMHETSDSILVKVEVEDISSVSLNVALTSDGGILTIV